MRIYWCTTRRLGGAWTIRAKPMPSDCKVFKRRSSEDSPKPSDAGTTPSSRIFQPQDRIRLAGCRRLANGGAPAAASADGVLHGGRGGGGGPDRAGGAGAGVGGGPAAAGPGRVGDDAERDDQRGGEGAWLTR